MIVSIFAVAASMSSLSRAEFSSRQATAVRHSSSTVDKLPPSDKHSARNVSAGLYLCILTVEISKR